MTPPSWLELLVRMTAGEPEEQPFTGILEIAGEDDPEWPTTVRVFKDRERYRVEDLAGSVLTIRNAEHTFVFRTDDEDCSHGHPRRYENGDVGWYRPGAHANAIERREPRDWRGDDFTRPTGPAVAVTYLGRQAWQVELAPPEHKPSPLVLTIDAVNGMTYEQRSVHFGVLSRWTELETVEAHAEDLFHWHGDASWYSLEVHEVTEEELAEQRREETELMASLGIGAVTLTSTVELSCHEHDDDGGFYASFEASSHGFVTRRPRSDEPWDVDADHDHMERWSDDTWDWSIGSDSDPAQVAEIRRQLAEPRHDDA